MLLELVRPFGGAETYINRVFLCTEEEIAPSSESSSDQRSRGGRDKDRDRESVNTPQPSHAPEGLVFSASSSDLQLRSGPSPAVSHSSQPSPTLAHRDPVPSATSIEATSSDLPRPLKNDREEEEEEDLDVLTSTLSSLALGDVSFDMDMLSSYVQGQRLPPPPSILPPPRSASAQSSSSHEISQVNPLQDRLSQLEEAVQVMNRTLHDVQAALAVSTSKVDDLTLGDKEEKVTDSPAQQNVTGATNSEPTTAGVDRPSQPLQVSSSSSSSSSAISPLPDVSSDGVFSSNESELIGHQSTLPPITSPLLPSAPSPLVEEPSPPLQSRLASLELQLSRLTSLLRAQESPSPLQPPPSIAREVASVSQETQTKSPLAASAITEVHASQSPEAGSEKISGRKPLTQAKSSSTASLLSPTSSSFSPSSSSSSSSMKEHRRSQDKNRRAPSPASFHPTAHLSTRPRPPDPHLLPAASSSSSSNSFVEYLRARDRQERAQESTMSSEDELQVLEHSIFDLLRIKYRNRISEEASDRRNLLLRPNDCHIRRTRSRDKAGSGSRPPSFDSAAVYSSPPRHDREKVEANRVSNLREEGVEVKALIQQLQAKVMRKLIKKAQLEALQIKQETSSFT